MFTQSMSYCHWFLRGKIDRKFIRDVCFKTKSEDDCRASIFQVRIKNPKIISFHPIGKWLASKSIHQFR